MRRVMVVLTAALVVSLASAQETPVYSPGENPFQGDYGFTLGRAIQLRVDVQGVRLDAVTVAALEEVKAGGKVKCEVQLTGSNTGEKKASLTAVLLLEDADGKGFQPPLKLDPFKVKSGRPFDEKQKVEIPADTLAGAAKVYIFVQVAF
jgi:hypothetical protein